MGLGNKKIIGEKSSETILKGIGASPGICIGKAYLVDREGVDIVKKYYVAQDQVVVEEKRFKSAVKKAKDELYAIMEEAPEELKRDANIIETHLVLLKDKMLYGRTIETIEKEKVNAEWALKMVTASLKATFREMPDQYFRERAADIIHVSDRVMRYLTGAASENIASIDKRVVLVAVDLSPAETSQIQLEKVKGFITDHGGMTSHTGIIARALGIPAVLGLDDATSIVRSDELIIVDGTAGLVIIDPKEETLLGYEEKRARFEEYRAAAVRGSHKAAVSVDGTNVLVMGNIELPEEVVSVRDHGGDGVGLYRTEFQYLSRAVLPQENELFEKYKDVVEVMAPRPVTFRTLDINGEKAFSAAVHAQAEEKNPALGLRAIRYCLKHRSVFKTQLRAMLRAAAFGKNARIMFPMISAYDEVIETKKILRQTADALDREGLAFNSDIDIGIMIEVPSAVIIADLIADEVDFFSIGTNDLIQYSLAIDRGNRHVAHMFKPLHPAILRLLKQVSDVAKDKGKKIFVCGEMAADPLHLPLLMGLGMDELSMTAQSIPEVKRMIRSINIGDAREFIKDLFKQKTAEGAHRLLEKEYAGLLPVKNSAH